MVQEHYSPTSSKHLRCVVQNVIVDLLHGILFAHRNMESGIRLILVWNLFLIRIHAFLRLSISLVITLSNSLSLCSDPVRWITNNGIENLTLSDHWMIGILYPEVRHRYFVVLEVCENIKPFNFI